MDRGIHRVEGVHAHDVRLIEHLEAQPRRVVVGKAISHLRPDRLEPRQGRLECRVLLEVKPVVCLESGESEKKEMG